MKLFLCSIFLFLAAMPPADLNRHTRQIADQLRCPVCRGIPISDSPAELAKDMVKIIRGKIIAGETDGQILNYFSDRYGEWILLSPTPKGFNLIVWILPLLALLGGAVFVSFKISRWSRK